MEGLLTKVCLRHPTPPPHGPNGQVLSVSEAEGLGLQGPVQEPAVSRKQDHTGPSGPEAPGGEGIAGLACVS